MDCSIEIPVCLNFSKPVLLITPISLTLCLIYIQALQALSFICYRCYFFPTHTPKLFLHSTSNWVAVVQIYGRQRMKLRTHTYVHTRFTWIYVTRTHTKQNPCNSTALWICELPIPHSQGETASVFCFVFCFVCV